MRSVLLLLILAFVGSGTRIWAMESSQNHEAILRAILEHIESNFRHPLDKHKIEISPLDARLQLPPCSKALEAFTLPGSKDVGNISVGVRCSGEKPWTIYHKASIRVFKDVAVLRSTLRQGATVTESDIELVGKDVTQLRGGYLQPAQAIGKSMRKTLSAGTVLIPDHLAGVKLIRRGQAVTIRAQSANFDVSMPGVALMDGEEGQRIRVRNEDSKRIVQGVVMSEGVVTVGR